MRQRRGGFSPPGRLDYGPRAGKTRPYVRSRGCILFSRPSTHETVSVYSRVARATAEFNRRSRDAGKILRHRRLKPPVKFKAPLTRRGLILLIFEKNVWRAG